MRYKNRREKRPCDDHRGDASPAYQGVKNEKGVYITPAFPKLIYVLEEDNIQKEANTGILQNLLHSVLQNVWFLIIFQRKS